MIASLSTTAVPASDRFDPMLSAFLPDGMSLFVAGMLLLASLTTSLFTASMGAGGGVILVSVMSLWLPPMALIPVHGMVQLGSNVGRTAMTWRHVHWPTIAWFVPGVVVGTAAGGLLLVRLPEALWQLVIGLFVLYLCWGPPLPRRAVGPKGIALVGAFTSFAGLFVGASGPLVAAYLKQLHSQRFTNIATYAATMVAQHGPKVLVFAIAGFAFGQWLPLIVGMMAAGALGTWIGLRLLGRLSDKGFKLIFDLLLTVLALRLLWLSGHGFGVV
jgi:uncharacterized protein